MATTETNQPESLMDHHPSQKDGQEKANPLSYAHDDLIPHTHAYLLPAVLRCLPPASASIFEIGCGNGSTAKALIERGYSVCGIDSSEQGIEHAQGVGDFRVQSAYDDLSEWGQFDVVLSLEVIEHLVDPRTFALQVKRLLKPSGIAIISTPYHGYLKNLALSITNKWDAHHGPLWDGGHIKFWSRDTLRELFSEVEMRESAFHRVGRIPPLAKSMIGTYSLI